MGSEMCIRDRVDTDRNEIVSPPNSSEGRINESGGGRGNVGVVEHNDILRETDEKEGHLPNRHHRDS